MLCILHLRGSSTNIIGVLLNFPFIYSSGLNLWQSVCVSCFFYRALDGEKEHSRVRIRGRGREPEAPAAGVHSVGRGCTEFAKPPGGKGDQKPPVASRGRPWVFSSLLGIPRIAATWDVGSRPKGIKNLLGKKGWGWGGGGVEEGEGSGWVVLGESWKEGKVPQGRIKFFTMQAFTATTLH